MAAPIVRRKGGRGRHAPGEQAIGQRTVGQHADIVGRRVGQGLGLDVPPEHVIWRLQCLHLAIVAQLVDLLGIVVGYADVANQAFADQLLQGRQRSRRPGWTDRASAPGRGRCNPSPGCADWPRRPPQPAGACISDQGGPVHTQTALGRHDHLVAAHPLPEAFTQQAFRDPNP